MWGFLCWDFCSVFPFTASRTLCNASRVGENMLKVMEMQSIGPSPTADTWTTPGPRPGPMRFPHGDGLKTGLCCCVLMLLAAPLILWQILGLWEHTACLHFQMMAELGCTESWDRVAEPEARSPQGTHETSFFFFTTFIRDFCSKTQPLPGADAHTELAARYGVLQRCSNAQRPPPSLQGVV